MVEKQKEMVYRNWFKVCKKLCDKLIKLNKDTITRGEKVNEYTLLVVLTFIKGAFGNS